MPVDDIGENSRIHAIVLQHTAGLMFDLSSESTGLLPSTSAFRCCPIIKVDATVDSRVQHFVLQLMFLRTGIRLDCYKIRISHVADQVY